MQRTITIDVPGISQPKGSTRMLPLRGKAGARRMVITSDNPKANAWQRSIAWSARQETRNADLTFGPVSISATFYLPRPVSLARHITAPIKKPDLDKLLRSLCDALTGVVYYDDSQVIECNIRKRYAAVPHAVIEVTRMEWP